MKRTLRNITGPEGFLADPSPPQSTGSTTGGGGGGDSSIDAATKRNAADEDELARRRAAEKSQQRGPTDAERLAELQRRAANGELTDEEMAELDALQGGFEDAEAERLAARMAELQRRAANGELSDAEKAELDRLQGDLAELNARAHRRRKRRDGREEWRAGGTDQGWNKQGFDTGPYDRAGHMGRQSSVWKAGGTDFGWQVFVGDSGGYDDSPGSRPTGQSNVWKGGGQQDGGWNSNIKYMSDGYGDDSHPVNRERRETTVWKSGGTDASTWNEGYSYTSDPYVDSGRPHSRQDSSQARSRQDSSQAAWRGGGGGAAQALTSDRYVDSYPADKLNQSPDRPSTRGDSRGNEREQWRAPGLDAGWTEFYPYEAEPYEDPRPTTSSPRPSTRDSIGGPWRDPGPQRGWQDAHTYDSMPFDDRPATALTRFSDDWRPAGGDGGWKEGHSYMSTPYTDPKPFVEDSPAAAAVWRDPGVQRGWQETTPDLALAVCPTANDGTAPSTQWYPPGADPAWPQLPSCTQPGGPGEVELAHQEGDPWVPPAPVNDAWYPRPIETRPGGVPGTGADSQEGQLWYPSAEVDDAWKQMAPDVVPPDDGEWEYEDDELPSKTKLPAVPAKRGEEYHVAESPPRPPRSPLPSSVLYESTLPSKRPERFNRDHPVSVYRHHRGPVFVLGCTPAGTPPSRQSSRPPTRQQRSDEATGRSGVQRHPADTIGRHLGSLAYEAAPRKLPNFALLPTDQAGRASRQQSRPWTPSPLTRRAITPISPMKPANGLLSKDWPESSSAPFLKSPLARGQPSMKAGNAKEARLKEMAKAAKEMPRPKSQGDLRPPHLWWLKDVEQPVHPHLTIPISPISPIRRLDPRGALQHKGLV